MAKCKNQNLRMSLKLLAALCFWLALTLVFFPVAQAAAPTSTDIDISTSIRSPQPDGIVFPTSSKLIPLGKTTGIKMFSEGTMIVGFSEPEEGRSPANEAGLQVGDVIVAVNDRQVASNEDLVARLSEITSGDVVITVRRGGQLQNFTVKAVYVNDAQTAKIGAWVRDSIAGIGTITFVDPTNGAFGALGHGISDADTGTLMPFQEGSIMKSSVAGVKKGEPGTPGELTGKFDLSKNQGVIYSNTEKGIFGQITDANVYSGYQAMEIADKAEIKTGKAYIISNVEGESRREFQIEIAKVYSDGDGSSRDMMIKIVDADLLGITGGIVQGMSGSPIIQNGKIVGAVTHVLINDPTRGYGISIQNMLAQAMVS